MSGQNGQSQNQHQKSRAQKYPRHNAAQIAVENFHPQKNYTINF
jgi:hypothetical protein